MSKEILSELKIIKSALFQLIGSPGLPVNVPVSPEILDQAGRDFQKLQIMSGNWLDSHEVREYFKIENFRDNIGTFIIEEFQFTNYFTYRKRHYFNKADIISLKKELKARNVNLSRYFDLKLEEKQFLKNIQIAGDNKKANKGMPYWLSEMVQNVENTDPPRPSIEIVEAELEVLSDEFEKFKLSKYIDVYQGQYAMIKLEHQFKKYLSADIKKQCNIWCVNFNYALNALKILDERKASLIKMRNDDEIEL